MLKLLISYVADWRFRLRILIARILIRRNEKYAYFNKNFEDGSHLEYDRGVFDSWCVYLVQNDGARRPPLDVDYFNQLKELGVTYGNHRVYEDFVSIYDVTTRDINGAVLDRITLLANAYENSIEVDKLFTTLYMAMVAEEIIQILSWDEN